VGIFELNLLLVGIFVGNMRKRIMRKGNLKKRNMRNTIIRNTRKRKMNIPLYSFITHLLRFMTPPLEDGIPWLCLHFL
jgi:hypothetical protein